MLVLECDASITSRNQSIMCRHRLLHKRPPTMGSNTSHSELRDDNQRMRLRGHRSGHITHTEQARELGATHQPPRHRKTCFAGSPKPGVLRLSSRPRRDTTAAPPHRLHPKLLEHSLQAPGAVRTSQLMPQEYCRTFTGVHEENEHIIRCKANVGKAEVESNCTLMDRPRTGRLSRAMYSCLSPAVAE